jgi:hypothetical protein
MKRTTICLPDDVARALSREARRRGVSVSSLAAEAIAARLGRATGKRVLPWIGIGRSGHRHTARDAEEVLRKAFAVDRDR